MVFTLFVKETQASTLVVALYWVFSLGNYTMIYMHSDCAALNGWLLRWISWWSKTSRHECHWWVCSNLKNAQQTMAWCQTRSATLMTQHSTSDCYMTPSVKTDIHKHDSFKQSKGGIILLLCPNHRGGRSYWRRSRWFSANTFSCQSGITIMLEVWTTDPLQISLREIKTTNTDRLLQKVNVWD